MFSMRFSIQTMMRSGHADYGCAARRAADCVSPRRSDAQLRHHYRFSRFMRHLSHTTTLDVFLFFADTQRHFWF